jgi:hypothetical protein
MAWSVVPVCEGPVCQQPPEHPAWAGHPQMRWLLSRLDEQQRRGYVALEANRLGEGGVSQRAAIPGRDEKTLRRGQADLAEALSSLGYGNPVRAVPRGKKRPRPPERVAGAGGAGDGGRSEERSKMDAP